MPDLYRHSLFLDTIEGATTAGDWLETWYAKSHNLEEVYLSNDGDSRSVECRFFTTEKIPDFDQRWILQETKTVNYAFNAEDG